MAVGFDLEVWKAETYGSTKGTVTTYKHRVLYAADHVGRLQGVKSEVGVRCEGDRTVRHFFFPSFLNVCKLTIVGCSYDTIVSNPIQSNPVQFSRDLTTTYIHTYIHPD